MVKAKYAAGAKSILAVLAAGLLALGSLIGLPARAQEDTAFNYLTLNAQPNTDQKPQAGDLLSGLDEAGLNEMGLAFVDDTDPTIQYGWQYLHESTQLTPADAYNHTSRYDGWSLEPTITYTFQGTYIAVIMQAGPRVANHCFKLDDEPVKKVLPYSSDSLHFAVVFAADGLTPGEHTLTVSLEDGKGTQDWYAEFDAFIVGSPVAEGNPEKPVLTKDLPGAEKVTVGGRLALRCQAKTEDAGILSYQWTKDGQPLAGVTGPVYVKTGVTDQDAGKYQVKAVNAMGNKAEECLSTVCDVTVESTKYVPQLTSRWSDAKKIVGDDPAEFLSDFCLIQDAQDRWHAIGIAGQEKSDDKTFFHAIGQNLTDHYTYTDRVKSDGDKSLPDTGHMWAPYAVHSPDGNTYMYYHHYNEKDASVQMRVLAATDDTLEHWVPFKSDQFKESNIAFVGGGCRDACIFYDEEVGCYFMYYADGGINLRTSTDLLNWSEPTLVLAAPPKGYTEAESPFVIKRFGYYYLFVSGFDYGRVAVYRSADPRYFGNGIRDFIGELNGHAPEIVTVDGADYIACAAINEAPANGPYPGGKPVQTSLGGVYLQKLDWKAEENAVWLDTSLLQETLPYEKLTVDPSPDTDAFPKAGDVLSGLDEKKLNQKGYTFIDDTDENIQYTWRYLHPSTQMTPEDAYNHTSKVNGYALDSVIEYDFEGTSIAVVMKTGPNACVNNFFIDGRIVRSILPYAEDPQFCVVFAVDNLPEGMHHIKITQDEGLNIQDWYGEFDAFIIDTPRNDAKDSPLYGKTALYVGDSISYGAGEDTHRGWAGRIGAKYAMKTDNNSVSGTSLSVSRPGRIITQLKQAKNNTYDYVILHGGVNDAWDSVKVGKMSGSFDLASFDTGTFAGGLEELFYHAVQYFPLSRIGYIFNFRITLDSGNLADMSAYFDVAKQICQKWGIPYLDLYNDDNINTNVLKNTTTEYLLDLVHPNAAGYNLLTPYIAAWMETLPSCKTEIPLENARPIFSLDEGIYDRSQTVEISSPVSGAKIYYTLDGSYPTAAKQAYTAPIVLDAKSSDGQYCIRAVAVKDGRTSLVSESRYTIVSAATEADRLDADSMTNWKVTGGGTWSVSDGTIIQSDNDTDHNNWDRSLTYTKRTYKNFVAEGTFKFGTTDAGAWGFAGLGVRKQSADATQSDSGSGIYVAIEPKGRALIWVPGTGEVGPKAAMIPDFDIHSSFRFRISVLDNVISMAINDKQILSFASDSFALDAGYISVHAGLLPIEVSDLSVKEVEPYTVRLESAIASVDKIDAVNVARNTALSDVLAKLPGTVSVTGTDGNVYTVKVTWSSDDYNKSSPGKYTFTGAFVDLPDGLVNALDLCPTVEVNVVDGGDHTGDSSVSVPDTGVGSLVPVMLIGALLSLAAAVVLRRRAEI